MMSLFLESCRHVQQTVHVRIGVIVGEIAVVGSMAVVVDVVVEDG